MLLTTLIALLFVLQASATAHWKINEIYRRQDTAPTTTGGAPSQGSPQPGSPITANVGDDDEVEDCDDEDDLGSGGGQTGANLVIGGPGTGPGNGGNPTGTASSAPGSTSTSVSNVVSNERLAIGSGPGGLYQAPPSELGVGRVADFPNATTDGQNGQEDSGFQSTATSPQTGATSSASAAGGSGDAGSNTVGGAIILPGAGEHPGSGGNSGPSYTASFTQYGSGDTFGSGNCNTATAACGFYNNPGFNAAISQAVFGVGPGAGKGPACGTCYRLLPDHPNANSIVVRINNLCPDDGNPLCAQPANVDVNFDLCMNDNAASTLFGSSGTGFLNGTANEVPCSEWVGSADITS